MAFVKERISEEDQKKFKCEYTWIIDRERKIFMDYESYGREEFLIHFWLRSYEDGRVLFKVDAKDRSAEYAREIDEKVASWYDLFNFFTIDESLFTKEHLILMMHEALEEFGKTRGFKKLDQVKVKITHGEFLKHPTGIK